MLYVINGLGPGGAERSLVEMLPYFETQSVRTTILCIKRRADSVERAMSALSCEIGYLPPGGVARQAKAVRQHALTGGYGLIHTTLFEADLVGRIAAAGTGIPVLTSLVNTTYDAARIADPNVSRAGLWAAKLIDGWTARRLTTHFHAITEAVKRSAVQTLRIDPDRVTVIERGRDAARLGGPAAPRRLEARRRLGLAADTEVVVNAGRQEFQKGQRTLLEAASLLAARRPRLVVLVAGRNGHATEALRRQHHELKLGGTVRFLGHCDDLSDVLAAANVFAFPSVYEGLGGAVIEAMAVGLPVVASDLPALREVVINGESGILVPNGSAEALAAAVERMLNDPAEASAFGRRGMQVFEERFTIERSAKRMLELYERVATGGRHVPTAEALSGSDKIG